MNVFDGIFVFFSALHIPVNQNIEKKIYIKKDYLITFIGTQAVCSSHEIKKRHKT